MFCDASTFFAYSALNSPNFSQTADGFESEDRSTSKSGPWGQERRLEFIEFRLLWDGKINRSELAEFFGISIQQASLDFARYMVLAEGNMEYDRSEKVYRAGPNFVPTLLSQVSQAYLNQLSGLTTGALLPTSSFIGWRPPCDVIALPPRRVGKEVLRTVLQAIRDRADLEVTYQSMRRPSPTKRWIAPHALASDGARWHTRAWCHERNGFRDFVLPRIQLVHGRRPSEIDPLTDSDWHTFEIVEIEPRPDLTVSQRDSVITDYEMENGKLFKTIRRALVQYFVRHLHIDGPEASGQPIVWSNREALKDLVDSNRLY